MYVVVRGPVGTYQEGDRLLKIRQQEVVNEDDVLIVSDIMCVVLPPENQTISDEQQQAQRRNGRDYGENRDSDKAIPLNSRQRIDHDPGGFTG